MNEIRRLHNIILTFAFLLCFVFFTAEASQAYWDTCDYQGWLQQCNAAGGQPKSNGVDECYWYTYCAYCDQSLKPETYRALRDPDTNSACCETWESDNTICDYGEVICEPPINEATCYLSANAMTGGEVCNQNGECGSSVSVEECGLTATAHPNEGWTFSNWDLPEDTPVCTYTASGPVASVNAAGSFDGVPTSCEAPTAYFTKNENEELCDLYPDHDDYAVKVIGSKKDGACYEGITVVSSIGDEFDYSFTETHDPSQNTAAPLDSPWMTAKDWKEFCVNNVMPSQNCFDTSIDTIEPPDLFAPPPIDPLEPLDESPDQQDPEDQGEWAINNNLKKLDSNEQKRAEGIKGSIDSANAQNHSDLKQIDANSDKRTGKIVSAIRGIKFNDKDDTDEDKLMNGMQDYWNQQGDTISQTEQSLPEHTVEDYVNQGVTFSDEEISGIQTEFETEQTNYENEFEEFVDNLSTNEIAQKFKVQMQNPDCSFSVNMMGNEILFSFCAYGEILAMMGNWLIFISYVVSLYMVLKV